MMASIRNFLKNEEGVTALEYGLIAALIAGVIITAVTLLGTNVQGTFNTPSRAACPAAVKHIWAHGGACQGAAQGVQPPLGKGLAEPAQYIVAQPVPPFSPPARDAA